MLRNQTNYSLLNSDSVIVKENTGQHLGSFIKILGFVSEIPKIPKVIHP